MISKNQEWEDFCYLRIWPVLLLLAAFFSFYSAFGFARESLRCDLNGKGFGHKCNPDFVDINNKYSVDSRRAVGLDLKRSYD